MLDTTPGDQITVKYIAFKVECNRSQKDNEKYFSP